MIKGTIDGRRDLSGGRKSSDVITAEQSMAGKFFRSVCYSADGEFMIGGGRSPICASTSCVGSRWCASSR